MSRQTLYRARPTQPRPPELRGTNYDNTGIAALLGQASATSTHLAATERNVMGLPAAWAALNKIANAVAQMMVAAEAFGPDGRTELALPTVLETPAADLDSFTYWKSLVTTSLCRGNFIGIKADYDSFGYPRQVVPVPFDAVHAYYDEQGMAVYEIAGDCMMADEIVHVRQGVTLPGQIMAVGIIEAHRRGLGGMLDQQGMASSLWRDSGVPTGVVQLDTKFPTAEQTTLVKQGWVSMLDGKRTVAVTGSAMSFTPITWSADDAQFLESRGFSVAECALMFGLRPEDLGSSFHQKGSITYGNRVDDNLQRIADSYSPVMLPIEQQWSRLIPGRNFVRGNPEALLRSSTRERYELHGIAQQIGIETVDETRDMEGKPMLTTPLVTATTPLVGDLTTQDAAPIEHTNLTETGANE